MPKFRKLKLPSFNRVAITLVLLFHVHSATTPRTYELKRALLTAAEVRNDAAHRPPKERLMGSENSVRG